MRRPSHGSNRYEQVARAARLPTGARDLGATAATRGVSGAVALKPRDPAALEHAALAVSDPRSASYHRYLPKDAFAARYGPSVATIRTVESTLRAAHLSVTSVSGDGLLVHFRGTAGAAASAFRTRIANVRLASGRTGTETTKPLSFPAAIAAQVSGVVGLNTLTRSSTSLKHATHPAAVKPVTPRVVDDVAGAPSPCKGASGAAVGLGGLTDTQIADAYGVDGLYDVGDFGAGQTIAVYELEPFSSSDLATFDKCYFGSAAATQMAGRLHTVRVDDGGGSGPGSGESILDIEDVSALAPAATIDVYEAPNTTAGALDEYEDIVQADTAQVVTSSWGFCELDEINLEPGYINVENALFEQAALQGQTVLNASGDSGSDECAYGGPDPVKPELSQSDPASQPFVLGVGGTTILSATNPPSETVWNDGSVGGASGGGPSSVWGAPSWQQPFITGADKTAAAVAVTADGLDPCRQSADASLCREVPDVSAQADEFTGAVTIYTSIFDGWTTEGGTSSSAPLWAAILADINASSGCQSSPLGFVAPALYAVASIPAEYSASFNDVTQGNNDGYDLFRGQAFAAGPGYDMATGLGSPMVTGQNGSAGLANYLCALTPPPTPPVITSVSSPTVSPSTMSLTVTGSGFTGAKQVSIDGYAVPTADRTISSDTQIVISPIPTAAQVGTASFGPQDGTGRAVLSVTGSDGATSALNAASTLLYVNGTVASPVPSVEGVAAYGGPRAGGGTVTVFGSGFASTGPNAITRVTVGGVDATAFTALNPATLSVTIPAYRSGTTCAAGDADPTHDVCQAQVVVTNANGASAPATIRPPYTGQDFTGLSGDVPLPACVTASKCEIVAAVSEYDYLPAPTITSVTTTSTKSKAWASELGTTVATVKGSGFDYLGLEYANVGPASQADSQDFSLLAIGPRQFQLVLNGHDLSGASLREPFTVQTLGGRSASVPITYAGNPSVTSIIPSRAADTGGAHIVVRGTGLDGAVAAAGGRLSFASSTGGYRPRGRALLGAGRDRAQGDDTVEPTWFVHSRRLHAHRLLAPDRQGVGAALAGRLLPAEAAEGDLGQRALRAGVRWHQGRDPRSAARRRRPRDVRPRRCRGSEAADDPARDRADGGRGRTSRLGGSDRCDQGQDRAKRRHRRARQLAERGVGLHLPLERGVGTTAPERDAACRLVHGAVVGTGDRRRARDPALPGGRRTRPDRPPPGHQAAAGRGRPHRSRCPLGAADPPEGGLVLRHQGLGRDQQGARPDRAVGPAVLPQRTRLMRGGHGGGGPPMSAP